MSSNAPAVRRHDLDALRVGAFGLLILYHVGMFYVTWDFHVKSTYASAALEPLMLVLNPWRLTLLFIISGAATRFMAERMTTPGLAKSRSLRLLVPLIFGMLVIVPPQSWAEVTEKHGYLGSFLDFLPLYFTGGRGWGIVMPTYNHLWFVAYLWVYTMVAVLIWRLLPALDAMVARALRGRGLWIWPIAVPLVILLALFPTFGETHNVFADPYAHAHYFTAFLLGLTIARNDEVWARLEQGRLGAAIAAIGTFAVFIAVRQVFPDDGRPLVASLVLALSKTAYAWLMMAALFGYAKRYITRGGPRLTMLTEAVFPFYIIHQTTIVLVGHALKDMRLGAPLEGAIIIAATVGSCWSTYLIARSTPFLRPLFGLKGAAKPARAGPREAAGASGVS
jgi:glucan biosynthesis protein C